MLAAAPRWSAVAPCDGQLRVRRLRSDATKALLQWIAASRARRPVLYYLWRPEGEWASGDGGEAVGGQRDGWSADALPP